MNWTDPELNIASSLNGISRRLFLPPGSMFGLFGFSVPLPLLFDS